MRVAVHAVFIAKENILFLEEWIDYHLQLGFGPFYLYDNSKVEKRDPFDEANCRALIPQKISKHGVNYDKLVKLSDGEIKEILDKITAKYSDQVHFVEWSPRDETGAVRYYQVKAHMACKEILENRGIEWCASIDMDEFIVLASEFDNNIINYIQRLDESVSCVNFRQINYETRFRNMDRPIVTKQNGRTPQEAAKSNPYKYLYKVNDAIDLKVHHCVVKGNTIRPEIPVIHINHYRVNWTRTFDLSNNFIDPRIVETVVKNYDNYIIKQYL